MKVLKNEKGMTLVEIIVALLIASILLVIMGSLILNSFGYFNKTTDQSLNKQSLDSISSFVREQLLYTSDVRVDTKKPDGENWRALYIQDGKLFYDDDMVEGNDEQLYSDYFYNRNNLRIEVKGYGNYRLDLKYHYFDLDEKETVNYTTSDTLELLNVKVKNEKDDTFNPLSNIRDKAVLVDATYRIYFQHVFKYQEPSTPEDPTQGTVADQIACMNEDNDEEEFKSGEEYEIGDFVYIVNENGDKDYYRCLVERDWWDKGDVTANASRCWKKIDPYFSKYSAYTVGDVIIYNVDGVDKYYKCIKNVINTSDAQYPNSWDGGKYWLGIDPPTKPNNICTLPNMSDDEVSGTVGNKDDDLEEKDIEEWKNGSGNANVFRRYRDSVWYKFLHGFGGKDAPGTKVEINKDVGYGYFWQKIQVDWDPTSCYASEEYYREVLGLADIKYKSDVIHYQGSYYRVNETANEGVIYDGRVPADSNGNVSKGWERVYLNNNNEWIALDE